MNEIILEKYTNALAELSTEEDNEEKFQNVDNFSGPIRFLYSERDTSENDSKF